jgi:hypothetical protein
MRVYYNDHYARDIDDIVDIHVRTVTVAVEAFGT